MQGAVCSGSLPYSEPAAPRFLTPSQGCVAPSEGSGAGGPGGGTSLEGCLPGGAHPGPASRADLTGVRAFDWRSPPLPPPEPCADSGAASLPGGTALPPWHGGGESPFLMESTRPCRFQGEGCIAAAAALVIVPPAGGSWPCLGIFAGTGPSAVVLWSIHPGGGVGSLRPRVRGVRGLELHTTRALLPGTRGTGHP